MDYIKVKNWEDFQQYKDRDPKWIKLHRSLLDNYEYSKLSDAQKSHVTGLWLLAARLDNKIPRDTTWIGKQINASSPVDLSKLTDFIELYNSVQDGTETEQKCINPVRREEESREEKETEEDACPEPQAAAEPTIISVPLIKKYGEYPVTQSMIDEWSEDYPGVDVPQTLREIKQWNKSNPHRRKTARGIRTHITNWLNREQCKA
jgi:hypothetical protein